MKKPPKNILLVDKPKGISSYDMIRRLKHKYPNKKLGHAGTLDPLATGLMLVGIGEGTKKMKELVGLSKEYVVEVLLGIKTDMGDLEGKALVEESVSDIDEEEARDALENMRGKVVLPVPVYSAVKQGGERLHKKARRGEKVIPPKREMEIFDIKLLDTFPHGDKYVLKIQMVVSSGTYVRSIAEEIGERLGLPATVKELRRTMVGSFSIEDAEAL